jgi:hypothetical protein
MFNKIKPFADAIYLITSGAGASAIALNLNINVLGYALFLVSSIVGFYLAYNSTASRSILAVNAMFGIINVIGLIRYW